MTKGKLQESKELVIQATNNTKAQFANSPTLSRPWRHGIHLDAKARELGRVLLRQTREA